VIYSGLNDFYQHGPAKEIALNAGAIGGMMEECYAQLAVPHETNGWVWRATEATEIAMAAARKYFFCYGRDLTPAEQANDSRVYTYGSFLLTYDPQTTVIWEYYKTATGAHVMPESQLVALDPVQVNVTNIEQLRQPGGAYVREYRKCYLAGLLQGPCAAVVNPDPNATAQLNLPGYGRSLRLSGSGTFDGGTAAVANGNVPSALAPLRAAIVFK
jgi:hypothetical protein